MRNSVALSPALPRRGIAGASASTPPTAAPAAEPERLTLSRDPLRIALFILTIVTVSRVHQHWPILAKLRPALLLTMAAAAYAWVHPKYLSNVNIFKFWPMRRVAMLAVLACCSVVFGISLGNSGRYVLENYSKTLVYSCLLMMSIRSIRDVYTYIWAYVISCGILSYFATFVFKISKSYGTAVTRLSDLYMYDANDLGLVLIVGLAFTLLLLQVTRGAKRLALLVILTFIVISVARSGSRGAFLGLVGVGVAGLFLIDTVSTSRRIGLALFSLVALLLAAPPGYWEQMGTIAKPHEDYNITATDGRKELIQRGFGYAMAYPVFGIGVANFGKAECTISADKAEASGKLRCGAPHNSYVQAMAELGFIGLFVWSSLVFGGIRAMLKLKRRIPRWWRRGNETERFIYSAITFTTLAMIGFAITAFFLSFAWNDIIYILAAFMSGLMLSVKVYVASRSNTGGPASAPVRRAGRQRFRGWRVAQSEARYGAPATSRAE
jgi:O-antigen ligase